ncbi:MAG: sulfotransferase family 2 domain-containing protein [Candidatus Omnitrophota bacterium]
MLISYRHRFIFIHIPKTGGYGITKTLERYSDKIPGLTDQENHVRAPDSIVHMKARDLRKKIPSDIWDTSFKFAFARNPWDWQVSHYHFRNQRRDSVAEGLGFSEYLNKIVNQKEPSLETSLQKDYVTDKNGRLILNFIGKVENFGKDFSYICRKLGIDEKIPAANYSRHSYYTKYYTKKTRGMIQRKFIEDIEFFGYSFRRGNYLDWLAKREVPKITMKIALRTRLRRLIQKIR